MCTCTLKSHLVGTKLYRCHQESKFEISDTKDTNGPNDWGNAIYFFTEKENLARYDEAEHPHKMRLTLNRELPYIECTHGCFTDGTYETEMPAIRDEIAKLLRQSTVPAKGYFMEWLGKLGYAFQCYHDTDRNMEIAIPISWLKIKDNFTATFCKTASVDTEKANTNVEKKVK